MAVCNCCNRDMAETYGCDFKPIVHHGKKYRPIKVGDPGDFCFDNKTGRCADCGAVSGHYHHVGCDLARCPICGNQLLSCNCSDGGNRYAPKAYTTPPTRLSEVVNQAITNFLDIGLIDKAQRETTFDPWFYFLLMKVDANREAYAVYQITKVTTTYCEVTAVSVSGLPFEEVREKFSHFQFDYLVSEWGIQQQVKRSYIEKLLNEQSKMGDVWSAIRDKLNAQYKALRNIELFYSLQTDKSNKKALSYVCPRCGKVTMDSDPLHNALSRHATVYICDVCGTDEAVRDWKGIPLPLEKWYCATTAETV